MVTPVPRLEFDRLLIFLDRGVELLQLLQCKRQIVVVVSVVWLNGNCLVKSLCCFREILFLIAGRSEPDMVSRVPRLEFDRLLIFLDRGVELLQLQQCKRQTDVVASVVWLNGNCLVNSFCCFREISFLVTGRSEPNMVTPVPRLEFDRLLIFLDRGVELLQLLQCKRQIVVVVSVLWLNGNCLVKSLCCFREILFLIAGRSEPDMVSRVPRLEFDRLLIFLDRGVELLQLQQCKRQTDVVASVVWLNGNCLVNSFCCFREISFLI